MHLSKSDFTHDPATLNLWEHDFEGRLVTFCGLDGSGKTTTLAYFGDQLERRGQTVMKVRMPSNDARGLSYFRDWADDHRVGTDGRADIASIFIVLLGDRLVTVRRDILSALNRGEWVLCDRYIYTAFAQLSAIGSSLVDRDVLSNIASLFPKPDAAFIMDADPALAIARIRQRPEEADSKADLSVFSAFSRGYRAVAERNGVHLVPSVSIDETREYIDEHIDGLHTQ